MSAAAVAQRRKSVRRVPGPSAKTVPIWYAREVLGVSPSAFYHMRLRGEIPASAFSGKGRGTRVLRSAIESEASCPN